MPASAISEWLWTGCLCAEQKKTNGLGPAGEGGESGRAESRHLQSTSSAWTRPEAAERQQEAAIAMQTVCPLSRRLGLLHVKVGTSRHRARLYLLAQCHSSASTRGAWTGPKGVVGDSLVSSVGPDRAGGVRKGAGRGTAASSILGHPGSDEVPGYFCTPFPPRRMVST